MSRDHARARAGVPGESPEKQRGAALAGNVHILLTARSQQPAGLSKEECSD